MRPLYKSTKVIYNAHELQYEIWYKTFVIWKFDSCYKIGEYLKDERAKELAINRAQAMLNSCEIWKKHVLLPK
jgi:hypothetical protein